jgi:hypothetical protein
MATTKTHPGSPSRHLTASQKARLAGTGAGHRLSAKDKLGLPSGARRPVLTPTDRQAIDQATSGQPINSFNAEQRKLVWQAKERARRSRPAR